MEFKRRVGPDPHALTKDDRKPMTPGVKGCPDIWELDNGDFAVIGVDATEPLGGKLPDTASCGPDERIVNVPRRIVLAAAADLARTEEVN